MYIISCCRKSCLDFIACEFLFHFEVLFWISNYFKCCVRPGWFHLCLIYMYIYTLLLAIVLDCFSCPSVLASSHDSYHVWNLWWPLCMTCWLFGGILPLPIWLAWSMLHPPEFTGVHLLPSSLAPGSTLTAAMSHLQFSTRLLSWTRGQAISSAIFLLCLARKVSFVVDIFVDDKTSCFLLIH